MPTPWIASLQVSKLKHEVAVASLEVEQLRGALARSAVIPDQLPVPLPLPDQQLETVNATTVEPNNADDCDVSREGPPISSGGEPAALDACDLCPQAAPRLPVSGQETARSGGQPSTEGQLHGAPEARKLQEEVVSLRQKVAELRSRLEAGDCSPDMVSTLSSMRV